MARYNVFAGRKSFLPEIRSRITDVTPPPIEADNIPILMISPSSKGDPNPDTLPVFSSPGAAKEAIGNVAVHGANPVKLMDEAWFPTNQEGLLGAEQIYFLDANASKTQSRWDKNDIAVSQVLQIFNRYYGVHNMRVQIAVATNYDIGRRVLVLYDGTTYTEADNCGPAIYVMGAPGTPRLTVTVVTRAPDDGGASEEHAIRLVGTFGGATVIDLNLDDTTAYPTIGAVADAINDETGWTAYVAPDVDPDLPPWYLDPVANADVSANTLLTANIQSIVWALRDSEFVYAQKSATALETYYTLPVLDADFTAPTVAGVNDTPEFLDWTTQIDLAFEKYGWAGYVILGTTSAAVLDYLNDRISYYNGLNGLTSFKAFVGHPSTYDFDDILALRRTLNSEHIRLVTTEMQLYDELGAKVWRSSMYSAAKCAGLRSGNGPRISLSHLQINALDIRADRKFTKAQKEVLVQNGITFFEVAKTGGAEFFRICRGLTTSSSSMGSRHGEFANNLIFWINHYLRRNLQGYIGGENISDPNRIRLIVERQRQLLMDISEDGSSEPLLVRDARDPTSHAFTVGSGVFADNALGLSWGGGCIDEILWINLDGTVTFAKVVV